MVHKPNVWFAIFEIELENRGISADQAKYNQLVPRLSQQVVTLVEAVLLHPPKDGKYEAMKQLILKESQPSARARLEQLFHSTKLGDRKHLVLLRDIQQIAGPSYMSEEALKELWLSRLPDPLPLMLVAYPNRSLKELAITADAAFERNPQHMKASSSIFATLTDKDLNAKAPAQADTRDEETAALRRVEVSVIPANAHNKHTKPTYNLRAANGSPIASYGQRMMNLDLNLRRDFHWVFTVASVPFAIIGIDFLRHFGLLVDAGRNRILDDHTKLGVDGVLSDAPIINPVIRIADAPTDYLSLLYEHPRLVRSAAELPPVTTEVAHHIVTRGQPISARPRRLAPDKLRAALAEFDHMLQLGIVRPSNSS
ncbi:unnamed protein product [Dicrocoelium dendriticum]|nr:unnamed protein product [Dicrocoelium dendriticum]